jgi:transketolase
LPRDAATPSAKTLAPSELDQLCVNTIRCLAMDAVQKANSGHPGMPMGAAPMAYVLWTRHLKHHPLRPDWPNRDRFVLSAGHGSMLLYSLLHLTGYEDMTLEELKSFRQWGSKTPGHPENHLARGVETTTGPLGQGFGNGVGMAIAQKYLAAHFNRPGHEIVDYTIYAICSDGDLMEGVASEAASLAGHLGLGNIVYLYDDNHITIEGSTELAFSENVDKRFEAYGWHVQRVADGNDLEALDRAIAAARAEKERPSLISVRTHIAYGSPNKQDTAESHGSPLGEDEVKLTKQRYGWPPEEKFRIPEEALAHFRNAIEQGEKEEAAWQKQLAEYRKAHPDLAADWDRFVRRELPDGWKAKLPTFKSSDGPLATRQASGKVLNAIAPHLPMLIGGSADLAPSTNTLTKGSGDFAKGNYGARNLRFGVREHGMGAIVNGMALSGLIPYGATFLIFSDYMRPTIRLAALMGAHSIFVYTHDSVFLGEDGPTHQPIEQLPSLRAIPNLCFIRPCDANEVSVAWRVAIERRGGPVALALTRQGLPVLDRQKYASAEGLARGAYILADAKGRAPDIILIASGSEVSVAVEAYEKLMADGVAARVVSMPSWDLFENQPQAYKDEVFPPAVTARLAVEAASPLGWDRYVGPKGGVIGLNRFGASAPYKVIAEKLGFTAANVVARAKELLGR